MKTSYYNFLVPHSEDRGKYVLFNGLTKALFILEGSEKDVVEKILEAPNAPIDSNNAKIKDSLIENKFIVEDDIDELKQINFDYLNLVFNKTELSLTIVPTLQCNFNCTYCYQAYSRKTYKEEQLEEMFASKVSESIYKFVENKLNQGVKVVRITWYGGEPTLALNDINKLTIRVAELCAQNNAQLGVGICTNGYLLNPQNIKSILPFLDDVTITVDGPEEVHDKRRRYYGESSYSTILENLQSIQEVSPATSISLRVTIDKDNICVVPVLLDDLKNKGIKNLNIRYRSLYSDPRYPELSEKILNDEECAREIPKLIREAWKRGLLKSFSPSPGQFIRCNAPSVNSYVIMPNGMIHKCWGEIGTKDSIVGELTDVGHIYMNDKVYKWVTYNPTEQEDCRICKLLPICMGECCYNEIVSQFKNDFLSRSNANCSLFKYNLQEFLSLYAKLREYM